MVPTISKRGSREEQFSLSGRHSSAELQRRIPLIIANADDTLTDVDANARPGMRDAICEKAAK